MVDQSNNNPYIKGALSAEFDRTSIGTTPQDEKNILLETPDGESSYTTRRDTYASAANERSKQRDLDRSRKRTWQHLLFMINQFNKSIEAGLQEISNVLDDMRKLCEESLEIIDSLNLHIEEMIQDHEFVTGILDQNGEQDLEDQSQNRHVQKLLDRYTERTGEKVSKDNLRSILLAQIQFEQSIAMPQLQHKLKLASDLYDDTVSSIESIDGQYSILNSGYQKTTDVNDNDVKLNELESISEEVNDLKTQANSTYQELRNKLDALPRENNNDAEIPGINKNDNTYKSVNQSTFGMNIPSLK